MAPRSVKAKKPADVKVIETEAPKKGRGKAKVIEPEVDDIELDDKPLKVTEKKTTKREKKGKTEDNHDEQSSDESTGQTEESEQNHENIDSNGHTEAPPSSGRGRKKQVKKEPAPKKPEPKSARGRKNAKPDVEDSEEVLKDEAVDEKAKPGRKGRGRKPAKVETEVEDKSDTVEVEEKKEPASKGRKRGQAKAAPEKVADEDVENEEPLEEEEQPKKKEPKGRKGKKAAPKDDPEDAEEQDETPSSKKRKVTKKDDKAKDDDVTPDEKPAKGKRGQKKAEEATVETDEEPQDASEPTTKRRRKVPEEKATEDTKKKAPLKNKSLTDFEQLNFSNTSLNNNGKQWNFKISSWNVDGIRAWLSKGCLDYLKYEKPDILCLQEVKCSQDKLPSELAIIPGYHAYWLAGEKDGYAGVGIYTTNLAMNVTYGLQNEELDDEGRIITAEYEQFYLVCTYVPNSGRKLVTLPKRLQWNEEFRKHVKELDKKKPVIICGDMNVSHKEMDLANPKTNRKNAGFTDEERQGMTELLGDGFVDTFRHLYPDKTGAYTFWTYMSNSRSRNVGWRLDYFIISERLLPALCDNVIREKVYGSDHCPLSLFLHLSSADKPKE